MRGVAQNREVVRTAIEQVCARGDMQLAPSCYAEDFVDHLARLEFRGLEGVRALLAVPRMLRALRGPQLSGAW